MNTDLSEIKPREYHGEGSGGWVIVIIPNKSATSHKKYVYIGLHL